MHCTPHRISFELSNQEVWDGGHVARVKDGRGTYTVLVGRHEERRRRWEDNIKVDLQEVGSGGMD
jgi:hypothetical protein